MASNITHINVDIKEKLNIKLRKSVMSDSIGPSTQPLNSSGGSVYKASSRYNRRFTSKDNIAPIIVFFTVNDITKNQQIGTTKSAIALTIYNILFMH